MRVLACTALAAAAASNDLRPVTKVIKLLRDMKTELETEAAEDKTANEKMGCWCSTNEKEKTEAVAVATRRIAKHESTIEEKTALSAQLKGNLKKTKAEVNANHEALSKSSAVRMDGMKSFQDEQKDLVQSIDAMKNAIIVLGKHNENPAAMTSVKTVLERALGRHKDMLEKLWGPGQHEVVSSFLQSKDPRASYNAQSGQIYGILKNMKEDFEQRLTELRAKEAEDEANYAGLKAAKEREIEAGRAQVEADEKELAESNSILAQAKEDLHDTTEARTADSAFLADLKEKCTNFEQDYASRSKNRAEEIAAVQDAIQILNDPDAFDTFGKTVNKKSMRTQVEGFLQMGSRRVRMSRVHSRSEAATKLRALAKTHKSTELFALAAAVKNEAIDKVLSAIDKMVEELKVQQQDEVKHKDECRDNLNSNDRDTAKGEQNKGILESREETLKGEIEDLTKEIEAAEAEIKESKEQIRIAGIDRVNENNEFQVTVADQRTAQNILNKAKERLEAFYHAHENVEEGDQHALVQEPEPGAEAPPPPPGMKEHSANEGGNKVIMMLAEVIGESQQLEAEAVQAEKNAQAAYESLVKDTNTEVDRLEQEITDNKEARSDKNTELNRVKEDLESQNRDLEDLATVRQDLHGDCDFVMENFEIRQQSRADEMEALGEVKAVLTSTAMSQS
mmetsp:Transcript_2631/g.6178  ORF Transcript_2631/g.6178 Transcript_2631/m.6178 type:complete len:679 (-) Transcript_2631:51-2087(-)